MTDGIFSFFAYVTVHPLIQVKADCSLTSTSINLHCYFSHDTILTGSKSGEHFVMMMSATRILLIFFLSAGGCSIGHRRHVNLQCWSISESHQLLAARKW